MPSIVFGLWGIIVIRPFLLPLTRVPQPVLRLDPALQGPGRRTGSTILAGGVVLAVMILPIITSISREIFLQTPRLHEEAALALGATRWEMIRLAVFPYARCGMVVSATLLGLGRALGETMAIALIISPSHPVLDARSSPTATTRRRSPRTSPSTSRSPTDAAARPR